MIPVGIYLIADGWEVIWDYVISGGGVMQEESWYNNFLLVSVISETMIGVLYFVYVPFKVNGQTLGKKIMGIKAIDEFGNNPSFKQHFVRAIQNWTSYVSALTFFIIYISVVAFTIISGVLGTIVFVVLIVSCLMVLSREDSRGVHDLMTDTRVVKADIDLNKEFVEKTTQMSDWAEVVGEGGKSEKSDDLWDK